jgi:hypothetical protein
MEDFAILFAWLYDEPKRCGGLAGLPRCIFRFLHTDPRSDSQLSRFYAWQKSEMAPNQCVHGGATQRPVNGRMFEPIPGHLNPAGTGTISDSVDP